MLDLSNELLAVLRNPTVEYAILLEAEFESGKVTRWTHNPYDIRARFTYRSNTDIVGVSAPQPRGEVIRDLFAIVIVDADGAYAKRFSLGVPITVRLAFRAPPAKYLEETIIIFRGRVAGRPTKFSDSDGPQLIVQCVGALAWLDQARAIRLTQADQKRRGGENDTSLDKIDLDIVRKAGAPS